MNFVYCKDGYCRLDICYLDLLQWEALAQLTRLSIDASGSVILGIFGGAMLVALILMSVERKNWDLRVASRVGARFLNNVLPACPPGEQRQLCLVDHVERPNLTLFSRRPRIEEATGTVRRALWR